MLKLSLLIISLGLSASFAQTSTTPITKGANGNNNQPIVIIDGSKLINNQKNNKQSTGSLPQGNDSNPASSTPPPSNNVRIGSNGQYIDNSKSEQINSKGQICTTVSGKKTCN